MKASKFKLLGSQLPKDKKGLPPRASLSRKIKSSFRSSPCRTKVDENKAKVL